MGPERHTVRGPVNLQGGPLRVRRSGSLEGNVELGGTLRVAPGAILVAEGLTVRGALEAQQEGQEEGQAVLRGQNSFLQGALLGPGTLRNEGLLRIVPSGSVKYVCATVENVATVRLEGGGIYFGCASPNIPGVLENRGEVRLRDTSMGRTGNAAIHNRSAFIKDAGSGTAYIDPTFYAHPGGLRAGPERELQLPRLPEPEVGHGVKGPWGGVAATGFWLP